MILGIVGKVGGGKSLLALTQMLDWFCQGGCVATNIELDLNAVARYCWSKGHRFDRSQYTLLDMEDRRFQNQIMRGVKGSTVRVYIDEAHLFYSAEDFKQMDRAFDDVKRFVSQSRKVHVDIYLITQAWENLWGQFRRHAEFLYRCRDFRNVKFGIFGTLPSWLMALKWSKCDEATGQVLETGSTPITKKITDCYSTAQVYDPMMRELVQRMKQFEPVKAKVGWLKRTFGKPPTFEV